MRRIVSCEGSSSLLSTSPWKSGGFTMSLSSVWVLARGAGPVSLSSAVFSGKAGSSERLPASDGVLPCFSEEAPAAGCEAVDWGLECDAAGSGCDLLSATGSPPAGGFGVAIDLS